MRNLLRRAGQGGAVLVLAVLALWMFGPREPVVLTPRFDPAGLPASLDAYLASTEAMMGEVTPGVEKRIVWAGAAGAVTDIAVVYVHGFSATSEEIRPVPDNVARALKANLFYTRLAGHGLPKERFAGPTVQDWMDDMAEALAIGQRIGRKVIVIATSTGGTLAAEAALQPDLSAKMAGIAFVSPNFGLNASAAVILTWPAVRWWGPVVAGAERCFDPVNAGHARFWTTCYPTEALFPMAALAAHAAGADYAGVRVPALFVYSPFDEVVSPKATEAVRSRWGAPSEVLPVVVAEGDDPWSHVIAGDILSPGRTAEVGDRIVSWVRSLP
jgi:alpha-beta hydrolase superfamily lysophospholipase